MLPRLLAVLCAISATATLRAQAEYPLTPDSERQAGVPVGKVTAHRFESRMFPGGNWWIANQDMASALEYAGYETTFVTGDEGHNDVHGSAVLPDALRWLWRDWTRPIAKPAGGKGAERHLVTEILDPAHDWELAPARTAGSGSWPTPRTGRRPCSPRAWGRTTSL
jgi:hypothetical protein